MQLFLRTLLRNLDYLLTTNLDRLSIFQIEKFQSLILLYYYLNLAILPYQKY